MVPPETDNHSSGSPIAGEPVFLVVGKLHRPHGIRGEIVFEVITDFPERIRARKTVYVGPDHEPLQIAGVRNHGVDLIVRFTGIDDPESAAKLRNQMVYVKSDSLPKLPEGEFYFHEIIGLSVVDAQGKALGRLEEILETGANDVYLVRAESGEELLFPAIDGVILEINVEQGIIRVNPPEWR